MKPGLISCCCVPLFIPQLCIIWHLFTIASCLTSLELLSPIRTYDELLRSLPTSPAIGINQSIWNFPGSGNMVELLTETTFNSTDITSALVSSKDISEDINKNINKDTTSGSNTYSNTSLNVSKELPSQESSLSELSDVPIGDEEFPSFEEWRQQNLETVEADTDSDSQNLHFGRKTKDEDVRNCSKIKNRQLSVNSSAVSCEEDIEDHSQKCDDNLDNLDDEDSQACRDSSSSSSSESPSVVDSAKIYKDRFNYASFDCAATIVKSNAKMKGASNILFENKDSYLINECSEPNKFVIIELCQDILVDTVAIANYEFFSSMFKDIRLSVSDVFPVSSSGWEVLGEFQAEAVRDLQFFYIKNPLIWAKYLKIEFISHWGREFYCPVSLVRVHGTTMMDEYKSHGTSYKAGAIHEEVAETDGFVGSGSVPKQKQEPVEDQSEVSKGSDYLGKPDTLPVKEEHRNDLASQNATSSVQANIDGKEQVQNLPTRNTTESVISLTKDTGSVDSSFCIPEAMPLVLDVGALVLDDSCLLEDEMYFNITETPATANRTSATNETSPELVVNNVVNGTTQKQPPMSQTSSSSNNNIPTQKTQESIYQTITKRLSLLESNATMTMKYIEIQSKHLREILSKIETKQSSKIGKFFEEFNRTLSSQLYAFEQQYSSVLLKTITELQEQKVTTDRDIVALSSRMSLLADDLIYQRRLNVAQAVILLMVLVFVITTRGTSIESQWFMPGVSSAGRVWRLGSPIGSEFSSPRHSTVSKKDVMFDDEEDEEDGHSEGYSYMDDSGTSISTGDFRQMYITDKVKGEKDRSFYISPEVSDDNLDDSHGE